MIYGDSFESWVLEFEELNQDLEYPAKILATDYEVFKDCYLRGLTPDEALENFKYV